MALLFMDSFDHYATADITEKWTSIPVGTIASGGRCNTNALKGATDCLIGVVNTHARGIVGLAHEPDSVSLASSMPLITIATSAGVNGIMIQFNTLPSGAIEARSTAGQVAVSAAGLLNAGVYSYIEARYLIDASVGLVEIYHNGVSVASATGLDTTWTRTPPWETVLVRCTNNSLIDDLYIGNGDAGDIDALSNVGDVHVEALLPVADSVAAGFHADFTPSTSTDHGALVDDNPPNDDTDYNSSAAAVKRDTYRYPNLVDLAVGTVHGVQVLLNVRKTDATAREIATVVRTNGTSYDGTDQAISESYKYFRQVYEANPDSSAAWTVAQVNAIDAGIKDSV